MAITIRNKQPMMASMAGSPTFAAMLRSKEVRRPRGWLVALFSSLTLSTAIFCGMHALINGGGHGVEKRDNLPTIDFVRLRRDTNVTPNERRKPPPPPPPKSPPPTAKMSVATDTSTASAGIEVPGNLDLSASTGDGGPSVGTGMSDGDLVPLQRVNPVYPQEARRNKIEGYVKLELVISPEGGVIGAKIMESKPKGLFDSAAVQAVYKWRFKPKTVDGRAVEQKGTQRVVFELTK